MKQVPFPQPDDWTSLVREVEEDGEHFVLMRDGQPVIEINRVEGAANTGQGERSKIINRLNALRAREGERAKDLPRMTWEELKRDVGDDDKIDEWLS